MRIIAGKYKGRIIEMPIVNGLRPTQDKVREAIFNILAEEVPDALCLELYAGSGAIGIEALSRGAGQVVFVEKNLKCIDFIKANLNSLGIGLREGGAAKILKMDAIDAIQFLEKQGNKFNLIFLDPPYYKDLAKKCLNKLSECDILLPASFVIVQHYRTDILEERYGNLVLNSQRDYGQTQISFYKKEE